MLPSLTSWFVAGLLVGSVIPYVPVLAASLLFLCAVTLTELERRSIVAAVDGLRWYGSLVAGVLYWAAYAGFTGPVPLPHEFERVPVRVVGRIVEPVRHSPERVVFILSISSLDGTARHGGAPRRIRLTWHTPDRGFRQGDIVAFTSRVHPPGGTLNPGGFNYGAYLERQGIDGVASVSGEQDVQLVASGSRHPWWAAWHTIDGWRDHIRSAAVATLTQPALGMYLGIIIGERGYLDQKLYDSFMTSGTVHILSISGSHLGLIAVLAFLVVRRLALWMPARWILALSLWITPTRLAVLVTGVLVLFYTLLAGAEVATVRSLLMTGLVLIAIWSGHHARSFHALAFAALLIVVADPRTLFDVSFQLSFVSVLAIAFVLEWLSMVHAVEMDSQRPRLTRGIRWLRESCVMSGVVTVATLPLVAYYFHQIPWLGIIGNLVVVPFAGGLLVPTGLSSAVSLLLAGGDHLPLSWLNQNLLDLLPAIVGLFSSVPGGEWHVASPSVPTITLFYVALGLVACAGGRPMVRAVAAACVVVLLGWWCWSPRFQGDGDQLRVTFLDVGQGDAVVLELPDGRTVLIDGGATYERFDMGKGVVGPYLWSRGIRGLDMVLGTHPQLDHVGGLAWVLQHFPAQAYWGTGVAREESFYQRLQSALSMHGLREQVAREGQELLGDGPCRLAVLNPPVNEPMLQQTSTTHMSGTQLNNHSLVTKLECGPQSFLFAADIEADGLFRLMQTADSKPVVVLKVPHHGARSSLNQGWLVQLHPAVAVISVGRHNAYGHPAASVLSAYASIGARVFRTDQDGAVWITSRLHTAGHQIHTAKEFVLELVPSSSVPSGTEVQNLGRLWSQWRGTE